MTAKTALIIVTDDTEDVEFVASVDILRRANVIVTVANLTKLEYIKSKCNLYIKTDVRLEDVKKNLYDVVILPGGPSHKRLADAGSVGEVLREHYRRGKIIGAICAAPYVLFVHGIGKGKSLTSYPTVKNLIKDYFVYCEETTVVDGNLVTSRGLGTTIEFVLTLVEMLRGYEVKIQVCKEIMYPY